MAVWEYGADPKINGNKIMDVTDYVDQFVS